MIQTSADRVGISTATLFPMNTLEAFKLCCKLGFKKIELFINTLEETTPEFTSGINAIADNYGVDIISVHPYFSGFEYMMFFSRYRDRLEDSIKLYRNFFDAAGRLGAKYIVFHGDRIGSAAVSPNEYVKVFKSIAQSSQEYGVILTQENVSWCSSGNPDFIRKVRCLSDDSIVFTFDYKQAIRAGVNPFDMIDAMGNRIVNTHINSCDTSGCRLPFAGKIDTGTVIDKVLSYNYIGSFLIEVYRENFTDYNELLSSYQKCKDYLHNQ